MIYAYIRVSTDRQTVENQRFEVLKYADAKKLSIDHWVEETVSSRRKLADRLLGKTLEGLKNDDVLIVSELSRLGRNLMEVMSILHTCVYNGDIVPGLTLYAVPLDVTFNCATG